MPDPTPLIAPWLASAYSVLAPVAEALLRVIVGFALVPHGLRMTFGWFSGTGLKVDSLKALAAQLDQTGYRPGRLWAQLADARQHVVGGHGRHAPAGQQRVAQFDQIGRVLPGVGWPRAAKQTADTQPT